VVLALAGDLTSRVTRFLTKIPQRQLIRVSNTRTPSRHARHLHRVGEDAGRDTHATAHHCPHPERHPPGPQIGHLGEKMWKKFRPVRREASDRRVGSLLLRA
jgi:hypothetical protein